MQRKTSGRPLLTPEEAHRTRELISLRLSLKSVNELLSADPKPRRRTMLELAKNDLEHKIEAFEDNRSTHQTG